jgi:hypothetical protein
MRTCIIVAAMSLVAAALTGCGSSSPVLKTEAIEHAISRSILRQRNIQATVHCPPTVLRKAGQEFTCIAKLDVGSYPVSVTETNSKGHVLYGNSASLVILNIGKVERGITASILTQRRLHAVVSCPPEVIERAGVSFICNATVKRRRYPFAVTETNGNGRVRYIGEPRAAGSG